MIVDRTLSRAVLIGALLTLAALGGLVYFLNFLAQIHNIGTGDFSVSTALVFAGLTLPQSLYDILPVATLIGALFALGAMAAHQELMILRVAGANLWRIARAVLWGGLALALLTVLLGEFIAPPAKRIAETLRVQKMYAQIGAIGSGGLWIKSGRDIVHIMNVESSTQLFGLRIYTLDAEQGIAAVREAAGATFDDGHWTLNDVHGTRFLDGRTELIQAAHSPWPAFVLPSVFETLVVTPDNLSWRKLASYINYLHANGLDSSRYETAFWHKMAIPVSVLLMALLALPFSMGMGGMRSGGVGQRLALGVGIGLAYYLLDRTVLEAGQGFHLAPLVAAWIPTALLAIAVIIAMRRAK
ncbi:MAG: LPS export ABC transporter permease LptG [Gammaproteobacteria bacterium]|nr:LPS export ABC transporter permease LptG [Gammaproteobacteria bacterium]